MECAYRNLGYLLIVLLPIFVAGFGIPYLSEMPHENCGILYDFEDIRRIGSVHAFFIAQHEKGP
jgi:hypothetical protein